MMDMAMAISPALLMAILIVDRIAWVLASKRDLYFFCVGGWDSEICRSGYERRCAVGKWKSGRGRSQ